MSESQYTAISAFKDCLESLKDGKSYILNSQDESIPDGTIKATYNEFCDKSRDEGKDKKFDQVIKSLKTRDKIEVEKMLEIINLALWLWALPNNRKTHWEGTTSSAKKENKGEGNSSERKYKDELLNIKGVAGGGSGYVQTKTNGVRFVLYLLNQFVSIQGNKDLPTFARLIRDCQPNEKYYGEFKFPTPDGVSNLLLHLCNSKEYLPIASTADKKSIVKAFKKSIVKASSQYVEDDKEPSNEQDQDIDKTLIEIREKLISSGLINEESFSFYDSSLALIWKGESVNDLSLVQKLEYKKAMILYGPPGTSKTYSAMELAKQIIIRNLISKAKDSNGEIDSNELIRIRQDHNNEYNDQISYLQFHINYNYEDFIAGQTINGNKVETKKGFIFDVIEKAKKIKNKPYVVILDEINRTDISRVFGELFTAIEKRGTDVTLMLPDSENPDRKLILNVPENIYFIGTMNEIDFSLERIDFALRRRFVWELLDYNEDALEIIITERLKKEEQKKEEPNNEQLTAFYNACTALNKKIEDRMDETYHIGHAFFAEIANIYKELQDFGGDRWEKAKKILWQISIRPTLEAYCGTMDKSEKEKFLKDGSGEFYKTFFGKEETPK